MWCKKQLDWSVLEHDSVDYRNRDIGGITDRTPHRRNNIHTHLFNFFFSQSNRLDKTEVKRFSFKEKVCPLGSSWFVRFKWLPSSSPTWLLWCPG